MSGSVAAEPAAPPRPRLPAAYWIVWTGTVVNRLGTFVLPFLSVYLLRVRHLSLPTIGLLMAAYGIGVIVSGLAGGILSDAIGRRTTMVVGLFAWAGAILLVAASRSVVTIALTLLAAGLVAELYRPASLAHLADVLSRDQLTRGYGLLYWATNVGFSLAAITAGLLATISFWWLFLGDAATSVVAALIILIGVTPAAAPTARARAGARRGLGQVRSDGTFLAFTALTFAFFVLYFQQSVSMPTTLTSHGISPGIYGAIIAVNGVTVVVLQLPITRLLEPRRRSRVLALAAVLMGGGFGLFAIVHRPVLYGVAVFVWTIGEICMAPATGAMTAELAPADQRGTYQGVYTAAFGAARLVGTTGGPALIAAAGATVLWITCAALGAVVAVGHLFLAPRYRRRGSEDPTEESP